MLFLDGVRKLSPAAVMVILCHVHLANSQTVEEHHVDLLANGVFKNVTAPAYSAPANVTWKIKAEQDFRRFEVLINGVGGSDGDCDTTLTLSREGALAAHDAKVFHLCGDGQGGFSSWPYSSSFPQEAIDVVLATESGRELPDPLFSYRIFVIDDNSWCQPSQVMEHFSVPFILSREQASKGNDSFLECVSTLRPRYYASELRVRVWDFDSNLDGLEVSVLGFDLTDVSNPLPDQAETSPSVSITVAEEKTYFKFPHSAIQLRIKVPKIQWSGLDNGTIFAVNVVITNEETCYPDTQALYASTIPQYIFSPKYPEYPRNTSCKWHIIGLWPIVVELVEANIGTEPVRGTCLSDRLILWEGLDPLENATDVKTICGRHDDHTINFESLLPEPYTDENNVDYDHYVNVQFYPQTGRYDSSANGFILWYRLADRPTHRDDGNDDNPNEPDSAGGISGGALAVVMGAAVVLLSSRGPCDLAA